MEWNLLEADLHFKLQPLGAKYFSLESTWCSTSKYMFLGSRITNINTKIKLKIPDYNFRPNLCKNKEVKSFNYIGWAIDSNKELEQRDNLPDIEEISMLNNVFSSHNITDLRYKYYCTMYFED